VSVALPLFGAFVLGLGARRRLRAHFALLFRLQFAIGLGTLAVLSGWSFDVTGRNVLALVVLLAAQLTAVALASRLFRADGDGPLVAFGMFGNPTFWSLPVAAATLGVHSAVFLAAYDMLTQPRIALGVRLLRRRAPLPQTPRTALADYAPTAGAVAGVLLGRVVAAPDAIATAVTALGFAMAVLGSVLLGVAWPRDWAHRASAAVAARGLALHFTVVPSLLALATLLGADLPGSVWVFAFGPLPISLVSFARLYGYGTRLATTGLALSLAIAAALVPVAVALGS
jgi:predicted permease